MILIRRPDPVRPSEITPPEVHAQRRRLMQAGLGLLGAAALGGLGWPAPGRAALTLGEPRSTPWGDDETLTPYKDVTGYNNFYEFGTAKTDPAEHAHRLVTDPWSVRIEGECARPGQWALEGLVRPHALEERIYRLRCVEGWSMVIPWIGLPLGDLLRRFEPNSRARYVEFVTLADREQMPGLRRRVLRWPYREGLRIDEAMHPLSLLAVGLYGELLPNQNGAPLRLVVPWKYGFKSIKSIVSIRFVEHQPVSSWMQAGPQEYGFYSNVNPEVSHPRWSQAKERRIGEFFKRDTLMFNGYAEEVAHLYQGMDLRKHF